ncbi:MAG: AAA family ATPase [Acidobacteriota bacterium]
MYEEYYGFAEKPFSLTPDPKYLYRSESHANAFDLLQYAIRRREGFVVVTGDIGAGKTTLCRALLEQIDRTTFTALVLNPFLSEQDLLKRILLDFGVISREDAMAGGLAGVTTHELVDALYDFLLGLIPLNASAVLIIDEAQNLPLHILEQIRILSNLETDKEKLLQIVLVGQLNLQSTLRLASMRQLDQRISIRYELKPLDRDAVSAYVSHRLMIAGGAASLSFAEKALEEVHRISGGIPRLINLICDRALLAGYSVQAHRITPEMIVHAAENLDLQAARPSRLRWTDGRAGLLAGAAVTLMAAAGAVGGTAYMYDRLTAGVVQASTDAVSADRALPNGVGIRRQLPDGTGATVLIGSFPTADPASPGAVRALTQWLEASGYRVYYAEVDLGPRGRWQRVLAGAYSDFDVARADALHLNAAAPNLAARVVSADYATGAPP